MAVMFHSFLSQPYKRDSYPTFDKCQRVLSEIDDETARKARMVKAAGNMTWPEFVEEGAECLAEENELDI